MSKQSELVDYRQTEIGRQNWEVCSRMLVHDLLDLAESVPALKRVLDFYHIAYLENGGYTMALPRLGIFEADDIRLSFERKSVRPTPKKKK